MNCAQAREHLELLALDALDADRRRAIEAHLTDCTQCRHMTSDYLRLTDAIVNVGDRADTTELADRIGAAARDQVGRPWNRSLVVGFASLAAMLLVGLLVWLFAVQRESDRTSRPVAGGPMPPRVLWQQAHARSMPATGADAVVLHAGTLYFIVEEDGGRIAAVDADTGRRKWTSSIDSSGYMSADHSAVYTVARPEPNRVELIALSADSGRPLWRYAVSAERSALSRPVSAGDRVYWAHDGVLHAVESTWGKPVWQLPVDPGQPVVVAREGKGHLIVASPVLLARLQAEDGQRVYERRLGRESAWAARPIICSDHDRLFLARNAGPSAEILCCRISDGEPLWTRRVSRPVAMTAADGMLHVRGRRVRTLDAATGEQLWSYDAAGCGPVSRVGDRVVLADNSRRGELVALDCRSGEIAWRQGGIQSCDQLISANDVGYIKTRDGVLRAMTLPQKM